MMKKKSNLQGFGPAPHVPPSRRSVLLCRALVAAALALTVPGLMMLGEPKAVAQDNRPPRQRVIDGRVVNKSNAAIKGAIVYLKDSKSTSVRTFIADDDGKFHFGQLSQNTDYELWAELSGHRSKSKSISSFDDKNSFNFTLTVDM